jgi:hypothetical protein
MAVHQGRSERNGEAYSAPSSSPKFLTSITPSSLKTFDLRTV